MDASDTSRPFLSCSRAILGWLLFASLTMPGYVPTAKSQSVSTYHYDNLRTGWNANETTLTPQNVASVNFHLLTTVSLDAQVDAQPLLASGLTIAGGTHNVLYIATENNTIYALDAASGTTLATRNFGSPVPQSALPGQCNNNSGSVGINSTPVIDLSSNTMYVMVYSYEGNPLAPIFRLHAVDLTTLNDKVTPAVVSASARLSTGGGLYNFNPSASRQRSGLLLANGTVYAAFASFCDLHANVSRGWLLGWQAGSLTPVRTNQVDDLLSNSTNNFFLSSIWMSGYGVAADSSNNLYFSTGNSDYSGTSYSTKYNLSESIVKMSPDLKTVVSFFTPSDASDGVKSLDQMDSDFGSGGVLLLPNQPSFSQGLAVAAGKVGQMYLLNRSNLGGNNTNNAVGAFSIGQCWCGQSYFNGADTIGRVVSSGGNNIIVWKVQTAPSVTLSQESASPPLTSGQDGGFFTTISSNGTQHAIIWAVGRPISNPGNVTLYALDPMAPGSWLFSAATGNWTSGNANANIVPVVANGQVYVASNKQLSIFGLGTAAAVAQTASMAQQSPVQPAQTAEQAGAPALTELPSNGHEIFGTIDTINGDMFTLTIRQGDVINVNATQAMQEYESVVLLAGEAVHIIGTFDSSNILQATVVTRAKESPQLWPPDR